MVQVRPLTWINALPDALADKPQTIINEILGANVTVASFENRNPCDSQEASAFCYSLVRILRVSFRFLERKPFPISANRGFCGASVAALTFSLLLQLEKLSKTKLDSCGRNLVNIKKTGQTMGGQLCGQVSFTCAAVVYICICSTFVCEL
jgi:hypothetical protein